MHHRPTWHAVRAVCAAQQFLAEAVEDSTEGLIVKTLNNTYEPSKRSSHWLKVSVGVFVSVLQSMWASWLKLRHWRISVGMRGQN